MEIKCFQPPSPSPNTRNMHRNLCGYSAQGGETDIRFVYAQADLEDTEKSKTFSRIKPMAGSFHKLRLGPELCIFLIISKEGETEKKDIIGKLCTVDFVYTSSNIGSKEVILLGSTL